MKPPPTLAKDVVPSFKGQVDCNNRGFLRGAQREVRNQEICILPVEEDMAHLICYDQVVLFKPFLERLERFGIHALLQFYSQQFHIWYLLQSSSSEVPKYPLDSAVVSHILSFLTLRCSF